jgi:hypothetical protein
MSGRRDAGPQSETGRGLMLVAELTSRWDACRVQGGGKVTWAVV